LSVRQKTGTKVLINGVPGNLAPGISSFRFPDISSSIGFFGFAKEKQKITREEQVHGTTR